MICFNFDHFLCFFPDFERPSPYNEASGWDRSFNGHNSPEIHGSVLCDNRLLSVLDRDPVLNCLAAFKSVRLIHHSGPARHQELHVFGVGDLFYRVAVAIKYTTW